MGSLPPKRPSVASADAQRPERKTNDSWQEPGAYVKQWAMKKPAYIFLMFALLAACSSEGSDLAPADTTAEVTIDTSAPVATVDLDFRKSRLAKPFGENDIDVCVKR